MSFAGNFDLLEEGQHLQREKMTRKKPRKMPKNKLRDNYKRSRQKKLKSRSR